MARKVIGFDLDGTLAPSKSPLPAKMGLMLSRLLEKYQVVIMSGGKFAQFETQLLANLKANPAQLANLHLMPTCGTRYYRYDSTNDIWNKIYSEDFTDNEKKQIIEALKQGIEHFLLNEIKVYGETIEDRESQITYSALGQDIVAILGEKGVQLKENWDTDNHKKNELRDYVAELIPQFEVRVGGVTSIDVTKPGIDKAYGMNKLLNMLSITKEDVLFIGDRLAEGGNDYPIKAMGVDCMEISSWEETALVAEAILYVS